MQGQHAARFMGKLDGIDNRSRKHLVMEQRDVFTSLEHGPVIQVRLKDDVRDKV